MKSLLVLFRWRSYAASASNSVLNPKKGDFMPRKTIYYQLHFLFILEYPFILYPSYLKHIFIFHHFMLNHFFSLRPKECIVCSFISGVWTHWMHKVCLKIRKCSMYIALCVYAVSYVLSGSWRSICILHVGRLPQGLLPREIQLQECWCTKMLHVVLLPGDRWWCTDQPLYKA